MQRREFGWLVLFGAIPFSACVETDSQPDQVPIWVNNQTGQAMTGDLDCLEQTSEEPLLSTTFSLDRDTEESFYFSPVTEDGEYVVTVTLDSTQKQVYISGGRLREVNVVLQSDDTIQIDTAST
jgi:hypothetical protein